MDQNFYNLLYNGYTGEFQLIGALYRNGLDALRPPADMGVDVVTVNLKAQLQDPSVQPENAHVPGENRRGYRQEARGRACAVIRRCTSC